MSQKSTRKLIKEKKRKRQKQLQRMMLIGGGLLLVAGVLFAVFRNSKPAEIEVTGSPSLKVDQEVVDLNEVTLGNTVQVSFELTNVGDQELRFSEVPTIEVLAGC
jgi:cell division septal protein FtsQ